MQEPLIKILKYGEMFHKVPHAIKTDELKLLKNCFIQDLELRFGFQFSSYFGGARIKGRIRYAQECLKVASELVRDIFQF